MAEQLYPLIFAHADLEASGAAGLWPEFYGSGSANCPLPGTLRRRLLSASGQEASKILNGPLRGTPIDELARLRSEALLGSRAQGQKMFPLEIRIIDCGAPQALQVHPDEDAAMQLAPALPNTKFWYVLAGAPGSRVFVGLKPQANRQVFESRLNSGLIEDAVLAFPGLEGDAFLIPSGRPHAIGAGILMLEISQNSSPPLLLNNPGGGLQPSMEAALRAVRFEDRRFGRISRETGTSSRTRRIPLVRHCPHFVVEEIRIADHIFDRTVGLTFHLLFVVSGAIQVSCGQEELSLLRGEVCCIPAAAGEYRTYCQGGSAVILRLGLHEL